MSRILLGCCIPGAKSPAGAYEAVLAGQRIAAAAGFDYIEISTGLLTALKEEELTAITAAADGVPVRACNGFIPSKFQLAASLDGVKEYAEEVMRRMAVLGTGIVVFGSGKARNLPENADAACFERLYDFLGICSRLGQKYGVRCAIEPLRAAECNWINTVSEALALSRRLNLPGVRVLADLYHMADANEDFSVLHEAGEELIHVHVAEPDRSYPGKYDSGYLHAFLCALKDCGYAGRVSVECRYDDFKAECASACHYLRRII